MTTVHTTIAVGQFPAAPGDVQANLGVLLEQLESAGGEQLDCMCFPELCLPGYLLAASDYTDQLRQDLLRAEQAIQLAAIAADVRIVYGTARWEREGLRNCVVVAEPRATPTTYSKVHLAVGERAVFDAGDELVLTDDGGTGLGCCYDLAFAGFSSRLVEAGARVLCFPMAWECERAFVLEAVVAARAVENVAYVVCANQVGQVGDLDFHGGSRVVDPLGQSLCHLGKMAGVAAVELDLEWVDRLRSAPAGDTFAFASDRRDVAVRASASRAGLP
jgi:predicted amidohydrolase